MIEYQSFGAFSRHLMKLAAIGGEVTEHIATKSAELVEKRAKEKLGEYQDYAGPFNAWKSLAESTMNARELAGYPPNEPLLVTGELRNSITHVVRGNEAVVGSDSMIALWQECGTERGGQEHIPPRPFLGSSLFEAKLDISEMSASTVVSWICGLGWKRPLQRIKLP